MVKSRANALDRVSHHRRALVEADLRSCLVGVSMFPNFVGSHTSGNCFIILFLCFPFLFDNALDDLVVVYHCLEGANGSTGWQGKDIFNIATDSAVGVVILDHFRDGIDIEDFVLASRLDEWVLVSHRAINRNNPNDVLQHE